MNFQNQVMERVIRQHWATMHTIWLIQTPVFRAITCLRNATSEI